MSELAINGPQKSQNNLPDIVVPLMKMLSIIVPFYNEKCTLEAAVEAVLSVDLGEVAKQVILVDDGSTDGSGEIAARLTESHPDGVLLITLPENRGKGAAVRQGLEQANGDLVVIQDADLEYDPKDLPRLVEAYQDGVGAVFGSRRLNSSNPRGGRIFYWGGSLVTKMTNWLYGSDLTDQPTCYKSFRTEYVKALSLNSTGFEFCAELTAKLLRCGCRIVEVPIRYSPRGYKEGKKLRLKHAFRIGWTLIQLRRWTADSRNTAPESTDTAEPSKSSERRIVRLAGWGDLLLVLALIGLTILFGCIRNQDMDIWWHLKTGRAILDGQGIPAQDSSTFAAAGHEWIDLHWGFQVAAAFLYEQGGMRMLTLAAAIAAGMAVAVGVFGCRAARIAPFLVLIWLPAVFVMSCRFYARPETFSLVLLAAYLAVLHRAESNPRFLWWLVPIQVVWVSIQGLFVFGPFLLGAWLVDRWFGEDKHNRQRFLKEVGIPAGFVLLACFANPYGWRGAVYPLDLARTMFVDGAFYGRHIGELASPLAIWGATAFRDSYVWGALIVFLLTALSFLANDRVRIFRLLIFAVFSGLALTAIRNFAQFAMVAACVASWNLTDRLAKSDATTRPWRAAARAGSLFAVVLLAGWIVTGRMDKFWGESRMFGLNEYPYWHAHEAARFAAREGMPERILAYHEGQAALVEFYMRDNQRVFADPRLEVMQRPVMAQYYEMAEGIARGEKSLLRRLRSPAEPIAILIDHRTHYPLEAALLSDPEWTCAWFDPVAAVYVPTFDRRVPRDPSGDLAKRHFDSETVSNSGAVPSHKAAILESNALFNIARGFLDHPEKVGIDRRVLLLLAMRLARNAAEDEPLGAHRTIARCTVQLYRFPTTKPRQWELLELFGSARSRHLLKRSREIQPDDFATLADDLAVISTIADPDALTRISRELVSASPRTAKHRELRVAVKRNLQVPNFDALTGNEALDFRNEYDQQIRDLFDSRRFLQLTEVFSSIILNKEFELQDYPAAAELVARAALLSGDTETARQIWVGLAQDDPSNSQIQTRLGFISLVEVRYSQARTNFEKAIREDPADFEARTALAVCHLEEGNASQALAECEATLELPNLPEGLRDFCERLREFSEPYAKKPKR